MSPAAMMWPFATMSEVKPCTPPQVPVPPSNTTEPVSPSKPFSLEPFMTQTMGSAVPELVVEMGERWMVAPSVPIFAHQAFFGIGGDPGCS